MLQDSHRIYPVCDEICLVSLQSSWHSIVQISGSSWTVCSTFSPHTHFFQNVGPNQAIRNWTNIRTTHELYERDFKIAFQNRYRLITWFRISLRNQQSSRRKKLYLFSHNKGMVRLKIYNTRKLASNKKWIVKVAWNRSDLKRISRETRIWLTNFGVFLVILMENTENCRWNLKSSPIHPNEESFFWKSQGVNFDADTEVPPYLSERM